MIRYKGHCHCGSIAIEYASGIAPEETKLMACQCGFCRMHQTLAVSDPEGSLHFSQVRPGTLNLYRFGLKTSDFLVCRSCGAYAGAMMEHGGSTVGIANIHLLEDKAAFTAEPSPMEFGGEDLCARIARRAEKWMPATLSLAPS